ncbi:MAG: hypothetical protein IIY92_01735 [Lachnospiraceae bacterium]|nr:hypothetical protein [Lachnospiraceae bacterium]
MLSEEIKKEYERWSAQPLADADLTAGVLPWEGDEDSGDTGDSGSDNVFQI